MIFSFHQSKILRNSHQMSTMARKSQMSNGALRRTYNRGLRVRWASAYRHRAIHGMATISRALYLKAAATSPCNRAWMARWLPHPGHLYPVNDRNTQRGKRSLRDGSSAK